MLGPSYAIIILQGRGSNNRSKVKLCHLIPYWLQKNDVLFIQQQNPKAIKIKGLRYKNKRVRIIYKVINKFPELTTRKDGFEKYISPNKISYYDAKKHRAYIKP